MFAAELRRKRVNRMRDRKQWRWHLDKVFVKINGVTHYLWRAVDHEGECWKALSSRRGIANRHFAPNSWADQWLHWKVR